MPPQEQGSVEEKSSMYPIYIVKPVINTIAAIIPAFRVTANNNRPAVINSASGMNQAIIPAPILITGEVESVLSNALCPASLLMPV